MATSSIASSAASPGWIGLPLPTLTTKQRPPPLMKNPYTACERLVLGRYLPCSSWPTNVDRNCDQLSIGVGSLTGAESRGASPMNAAVLVPTACIGWNPDGTS